MNKQQDSGLTGKFTKHTYETKQIDYEKRSFILEIEKIPHKISDKAVLI